MILPLTGERKPYVFLQTQFAETFGRFSPDGRWIVYSSDETGTIGDLCAAVRTRSKGIRGPPTDLLGRRECSHAGATTAQKCSTCHQRENDGRERHAGGCGLPTR